MATYPASLQVSLGSQEEWIDDQVADRSISGATKVRAFFSSKKRAFTIVHQNLSAAQISTLESFYDTNRLLVIQFTWVADGNTYNCLFAGPPKISYAKMGQYADVTVKLYQQ